MKELVAYHPESNRLCVLCKEKDGINNLYYKLYGDDDFIFDVENLVLFGEL